MTAGSRTLAAASRWQTFVNGFESSRRLLQGSSCNRLIAPARRLLPWRALEEAVRSPFGRAAFLLSLELDVAPNL